MDPIETLLRQTIQAAGGVQAQIEALRIEMRHQGQRWDEERSIVGKRLDALEKAAQDTRELHLVWRPHVERIQGATDATLSTLGRYALVAVIIVAAVLAGGAVLPRVVAMLAPGSASVGGP